MGTGSSFFAVKEARDDHWPQTDAQGTKKKSYISISPAHLHGNNITYTTGEYQYQIEHVSDIKH